MDKNVQEEREKKGFFQQLKDPTSALIITIFSLVIAFPISVSIYMLIPPLKLTFLGGFRIEYFILLIFLFVLFFILIKKFSKFFIYSFVFGLAGIGVSDFLGGYGFRNLYFDYSTLYFTFTEDIAPYQFKGNSASVEYNQRILNAIDYRNEIVKNKANAMALAHFSEYKSSFPSLKVLHCFSIFKEVRSKWNYVYDPGGEEYYSRTSVTLNQLLDDGKLKGDCDDYSILMAGLFTAVGGEVRLVRTEVQGKDRVIGHLYPELNIGGVKDLEKISYFIKNEMFVKESEGKAIYYYLDNDDRVWLNMDYNDFYPGGKYQSMIRKSVVKIE